MKKIFCLCFVVYLINVCFAQVNESGVKIKWGYLGHIDPTRWGQLDPSFALCASGKAQSPINIKTKKIVPTENRLQINYQNAPLNIIDDGETTLKIKNTNIIIFDGHGIQLNFDQDANETVMYNGEKYYLKQFHIHSPSENRLNGQSFPLEIHFVHEGAGGKVLVIGVWVKGGVLNPALEQIVRHLPTVEGKELQVPNERINPRDLMPIHHSYFSFAGSLTTPPCTEGLQWVMMSTPITATPAQIVKLRQAGNGENARNIQKLNKRTVFFSASN